MMARVKSGMRQVLSLVAHRDSDLYLVLLLASLLTLVDIFNGKWVDALLAGTLGSLAFSQIRVRSRLDDLVLRGGGIEFLSESPANLDELLAASDELLIVGVSLDRTVRNLYTELEAFLGRGGKLQVVLVDPTADTIINIADSRAYNEHGLEHRRGQIRFTLKTLIGLEKVATKPIEVGLFNDPFTFGAYWFRNSSYPTRARIVVQHYSYKKAKATEPNPVFVLGPAEANWYNEFGEELENIWRDSTKVSAADVLT